VSGTKSSAFGKERNKGKIQLDNGGSSKGTWLGGGDRNAPVESKETQGYWKPRAIQVGEKGIGRGRLKTFLKRHRRMGAKGSCNTFRD